MKQLRLPGMDPPYQIHPSNDRPAPAFWVKRLRVLRELKQGDEYIVRDVKLRRGLNIVWAPPQPTGDENALFHSGVAGHTAGKTTFCRLIRHILGESGFATEATRRRIRHKLPAGWIVAKVVVGDDTWVVARPLVIGPHSFAIRGGTIAQAIDGGGRPDYHLFLEAVQAVTVGDLPAASFPASGEAVRWDHVLPWLTRDQECRFADFLDWRHSSSDSESPSLNVDERQFIVRSVLGLISDEERAEQQRNALLVSRKKYAAQMEPLLSHQSRIDHGRVSVALGMEDLPPPSLPHFGSAARAELSRRMIELNERDEELSGSDDFAVRRAALEQAVAAEESAKRSLQDVESRLDIERVALEQLTTTDQASLLAALPPPRDYCNVPMSAARESGCPLAGSRPTDLASIRSERTAKEQLKAQQQLVKSLEEVASDRRQALMTAQRDTVAARRADMSAATAFNEQKGKNLGERALLQQIERLVDEAEKAFQEASDHSDLIIQLAHEIDESYKRQELLRRGRREAIGGFSTTFDYVVRAILGDELEGRVDTSGRSLSLIVEEHGERDSAAIATVKLLAFDLAALTFSAEGHGNFPRFLLHDGPREADMASDIYERLFLFVRELEKCFSGDPSFQYILTTTTPPPAAVAVEPWVRLTLAGVPANERLLRCDL